MSPVVVKYCNLPPHTHIFWDRCYEKGPNTHLQEMNCVEMYGELNIQLPYNFMTDSPILSA